MDSKAYYRLVWLIATAGLTAATAFGQVFWKEDFNSSLQATSHWMHGGTNAGPSRWEWTDNPADGYRDPGVSPFQAPTASSGYFLFNSDANGPTPHDVWLTNVNRKIDCSQRKGVRLRFYTQYIYFSPSGTRAQIGVSTDGQNFQYQPLFENWPANLPFEGWVEVALPSADNEPEVWLRFRWVGNYEYHWKIDDLELSTEADNDPDFCETAPDLSPLFGGPPGQARWSVVWNNTGATVSSSDPIVTCWGETPEGVEDFLDNTLWFTFVGDGHRYDIQTVPCSAQNYVGTQQGLPGDTQMLLLAGEDCTQLAPIACNDDRSPIGDPDWRAGLLVATDSSQRYYLMIDGYRGPNGAARGEFCIQVIRLPELSCADAAVGNVFVGREGLICYKSNTKDYLRPDTAGFILPTEGEVFGIAWCITQQPIPAGVWPGDIPGVSGTTFSPTMQIPSLENDGTFMPFGIYYLTPVVLGRGILLSPGPSFVFNVRPDSNGCFITGPSQRIVLLPPLEPLSAVLQVTNETVPPGQNGAIEVLASGGSGGYLNSPALYEYYWSHGPHTPVVTQLKQGTYTVTIADKSACLPAIVRSAVVEQVVGVSAPEKRLAFEVYPNPACDEVWVRAELPEASEAWIEVLSPLGQVVNRRRLYATDAPLQRIDIDRLPPGAYAVRLALAGAQEVKRVFIKCP